MTNCSDCSGFPQSVIDCHWPDATRLDDGVASGRAAWTGRKTPRKHLTGLKSTRRQPPRQSVNDDSSQSTSAVVELVVVVVSDVTRIRGTSAALQTGRHELRRPVDLVADCDDRLCRDATDPERVSGRPATTLLLAPACCCSAAYSNAK